VEEKIYERLVQSDESWVAVADAQCQKSTGEIHPHKMTPLDKARLEAIKLRLKAANLTSGKSVKLGEMTKAEKVDLEALELPSARVVGPLVLP